MIRQVRDGAVDLDFLVWELAWELESVKCSCRRSMLAEVAELRRSTSTALSGTWADDLGLQCGVSPGGAEPHEQPANATVQYRTQYQLHAKAARYARLAAVGIG